MVCPSVRGDNPQAPVSGLSRVQVLQPWFIATFYEVDLSRYEKSNVKIGKGGLMMLIACSQL